MIHNMFVYFILVIACFQSFVFSQNPPSTPIISESFSAIINITLIESSREHKGHGIYLFYYYLSILLLIIYVFFYY